jgi:hypothetical protein
MSQNQPPLPRPLPLSTVSRQTNDRKMTAPAFMDLKNLPAGQWRKIAFPRPIAKPEMRPGNESNPRMARI